MTDRQENHLSMQQATSIVLRDNNAILTGVPGAIAKITEFNAIKDEIQQIRELQEKSQKGRREIKDGLRKTTEELTLSIALKTGVYAKMNDLPMLANEVNYTKSKLQRAQDTILRDIAEVVYNSASEHVADMADYGVTPVMLTKLRDVIDAYNEAIPEPRIGTTETKKATDKLKELFAASDACLKKLDLLMILLKDTNPEFYGQYLDVRKVIETNPKILALVAKITHRSTGEGIGGVKVSFSLKKSVEQGGVVIEKVTTDKGLFNIKSLPDGEYYAVVWKTGFMEKVLTVNVAHGDTYRLNVELETETEYNRRMEDENSI